MADDNTPQVNVNVNNGFTNKEILIRLEAKVDKALDNHENRLRWLEKLAWAIPATAIATIASFFHS